MAGLPRRALVLDVGAGLGALTAPLLAAGHKVIAVEAHPGRAEALRQRYDGRVTVVRADGADLRLPRRPFHVVANPPFGITSALLRRLLQRATAMQSATLILQESAALRWAGPKAPAAARWQRHHVPVLGPRLPRHDFRPPPQVATCILHLHPKPNPRQ